MPGNPPGVLEIRPIAAALGAEIHGLELSRPLDQATIQAIRQALLQHVVIFFRDQNLAPAQLLAFAAQFGSPVEYPYVAGLAECPLVLPLIKEPADTINFGGIWHFDTGYLDCPAMGTVLYAVETPATGGDTLFANTYLAYDSLSNGLKRLLGQLRAVNRADSTAVANTRRALVASHGRSDSDQGASAIHPVVRVHPETGRKSLFVNSAHTCCFEGMTEVESEPLLDFLFAHQIKPEFTCRFQWRPGSLAFWDNRASLHYPLNDYHGHRRVMHRVSLGGDRPH